MNLQTRIRVALLLGTAAMMSLPATAARTQRQMEKLGRGVVAVKQPDGKVFVGWRLLGTDARDIAFNLYRASGSATPLRLNAAPITGATNFVDGKPTPGADTRYFVRPLQNRREAAPSNAFTLKANAPAQPYLSLPLQTPAGYTPNDASAADLDGDSEYEIVLHQAGRGKDNSQNGETDPPMLQAYKLNGRLLWTINLGRNIREGAHYTQFMVYDLDGDGRAEMVCKTADGTTDGLGRVIGDAKANYVNEAGRILSGPEFLTVFDGLTGAALATTNYIPARHPATQNPTGDQLKAVWGDGYGNRNDRFLACVAYLDGARPSVVMARGYYTRTVLAAWNWRGGKLSHQWTFDSNDPGHEKYAGQGNHNLSVADVDGDGRDEIVYGKMCVDDNGRGLYSTGIGHGDAMHLSDLDPDRPGLEVFSIQEPFADAGAHLFDARSGEVLWKKASLKAAASGGDAGEGPGRGLALDIDPRYKGFECWVSGAGLSNQLWDIKGHKIADKVAACNMGIYWDGDLLSEILSGTAIDKWDYINAQSKPLLDAKNFGCVSNNGTKANPCLSADIVGDWREEVIWRSEDNKELRIFTTTIPTPHRFVTLMHDPVYRLGIAWQNVAYNQPPHLGFYLGEGMAASLPVQAAQQPAPPQTHNTPTLWLIGDSTVKVGTKGQMGWGEQLAKYFDGTKIKVENRARGGRSSRTYLTEGLWEAVLGEMKAGDFVMMQFGHNDGGANYTGDRGRSSLKGSGEETREVTHADGKTETVRSYGWYLRKYVADAKAKGAIPIVLSLIPRNRRGEDGKVFRAGADYGQWAREAAQVEGVAFIDLNAIVAEQYDTLGKEKVDPLFGGDWTHTNAEGAEFNARSVISGLKTLANHPLAAYLSPQAAVNAYVPPAQPAPGKTAQIGAGR